MKKFLYLICLMCFAACQKSSETSSSSLVYKVNGVQYIVTGDCDSTSQNPETGSYLGCYALGVPNWTYYFVYGSGRSAMIDFGIDTRSLTLQLNSAFGLGMRLVVNGTKYGLYENWDKDSMYAKITRFSNGSFDGIFSGSVSDSTNTKRAVITDGRFTNVKVIYNN